MDQFGVLVESTGFKSQNKSTPLADLKGKHNNINISNNNNSSNWFPHNLGDFGAKPSSNSSLDDDFGGFFGANDTRKSQNSNGSYGDDFGGVFGSSSAPKPQSSGGLDDVFGGYDLDSVFKGSKNSGSGFYDNGDDIFGGFPASGTVNLRNVGEPVKRNGSVDDLLGGFGDLGTNDRKKNSGNVARNGSWFDDDLIPGFGGGSHSSNGAKSEMSHSRPATDFFKSSKVLVEDPFNIFESSPPHQSSSAALIPDPYEKVSRKNSVRSSIDELEDFATARIPNDVNGQQDVRKDRSGAKIKPVKDDSVYDALFQKGKVTPVQKPPPRTSSTSKKASPVKNVDNDFSFLFGVGVAPSSGVFQEVEGESEDRRTARLKQHQKTQERMVNALNEKNQRDLQQQWEQEERHRLAATLDDSIKRWAAGKEGNMRALLSSLQDILWPECGWRPVSLTDLITSISVKKIYQKATLCVHPDKVQQKGANLQQKYIAEKVFDILKEAWKKFSSDEL